MYYESHITDTPRCEDVWKMPESRSFWRAMRTTLCSSIGFFFVSLHKIRTRKFEWWKTWIEFFFSEILVSTLIFFRVLNFGYTYRMQFKNRFHVLTSHANWLKKRGQSTWKINYYADVKKILWIFRSKWILLRFVSESHEINEHNLVTRQKYSVNYTTRCASLSLSHRRSAYTFRKNLTFRNEKNPPMP